MPRSSRGSRQCCGTVSRDPQKPRACHAERYPAAAHCAGTSSRRIQVAGASGPTRLPCRGAAFNARSAETSGATGPPGCGSWNWPAQVPCSWRAPACRLPPTQRVMPLQAYLSPLSRQPMGSSRASCSANCTPAPHPILKNSASDDLYGNWQVQVGLVRFVADLAATPRRSFIPG